MLTLREAAQQALEAMEVIDKEFKKHGRQHWPEAVKSRVAIPALRAALAEEALQRLTDVQQEMEQEPVAWAIYDIKHGGSKTLHWPEQHSPNGDPSQYKAVPLYAAPPQRTPLNDDQMNDAYRHIWRNLPDGFGHTASEWIEVSIRYAEQVHEIK